MNKFVLGKSNQKGGSQQCQKCLRYGHWTYECKNNETYLYRPSRTTLFKNKEFDLDLDYEKPPKTTKIRDADLEVPISSSESEATSESDEESESGESGSSSSSESKSSCSSSSTVHKQDKKSKVDEFYEMVQKYNSKSKRQEEDINKIDHLKRKSKRKRSSSSSSSSSSHPIRKRK